MITVTVNKDDNDNGITSCRNTALCMGNLVNQMGGLRQLQGFLGLYCITNAFLMTVMYRDIITIVDKEKNCDINTSAKTIISLSLIL